METTTETKAAKKVTVKKVVSKKAAIVSKKIAAKSTKKGGDKKAVAKRESTSGNYKNIRHLMETLFAKDKGLTKEDAIKSVKKEFPESAFLEKTASHFGWYKNKIVSHNTWVSVEPPAWSKGPRAKIKG